MSTDTEQTKRTGRPPVSNIGPGQQTPQRQIRISDEDWYGGAEKAGEIGTTISDVTRRLVRAWRLGEIELPD